MAKTQFKVQRAGAYVVKAAESSRSTVAPKPAAQQTTPSSADRQAAHAVRSAKSSL